MCYLFIQLIDKLGHMRILGPPCLGRLSRGNHCGQGFSVFLKQDQILRNILFDANFLASLSPGFTLGRQSWGPQFNSILGFLGPAQSGGGADIGGLIRGQGEVPWNGMKAYIHVVPVWCTTPTHYITTTLLQINSYLLLVRISSRQPGWVPSLPLLDHGWQKCQMDY